MLRMRVVKKANTRFARETTETREGRVPNRPQPSDSLHLGLLPGIVVISPVRVTVNQARNTRISA